jgi:hypothetical protein
MADQEIDPEKNSLAPTVRADDDGDAANMNKGNGLRLVGFTAGAAALVALLVAVLGNLDNRQAYVDAGSHIASLHEDGFEGFWNCALVNMNQAQLKSAEDLEFQLEKRAEHFGHAYIAQIKKCGTGLDTLERDLATVSVPSALRPQTQAMEHDAGALRHAMQDFTATLDEHKTQYDADATRPAIKRVAAAWDKYRNSHKVFTDSLRGHLN